MRDVMGGSYDVIVIGAGPAGSVAALEAARLGCRRVLLLEQEEFPRDRACAGGLSPKACSLLKEMGLWQVVGGVAYPIHAARLLSPSGREAVLMAKRGGAVIDRGRFDQAIVDAAIRAGVEFRPATRVDALLQEAGRAGGVRCGLEEFRARWVVAADGGAGRFSRQQRPRRLLHACIARFEGLCLSPNRVEIVYDRNLLPHYGWLFPESNNRANVGVVVLSDRLRGRSLRVLFEAFIDRHYAAQLSGAVQLGPLKGRALLTAATISHHAPPGVLLAGEAARLTNIATGEGILYAMLSGRLAARIICKAERLGLSTAQATAAYAARLRVAMQPTFLMAGLYCAGGVRMLDGLMGLARVQPTARLLTELLMRL